MTIYASDLECSGLLDDMRKQEKPRLHNFCAMPVDVHNTSEEGMRLFLGTDRQGIQDFLNEGHTLVMHNGSTFDEEVLEFFELDTSKVKLIDTLPLSWYLEPNRLIHGLDAYGKDFGVEKPKIDDWESLTQEDYNHRVIEDCKIQRLLFKRQVQQLKMLYGETEEDYQKILNFMMFKQQQQVIQQRHRWKLDVPKATSLQVELETAVSEKVVKLIEAMPQNPIYTKKSRPAKPFKKDGSMSASGLAWKEVCEKLQIPFEHEGEVKVLKSHEPGNPSSHTQVKAWLDSLGWEPMTFKFVREPDGSMRKIPQVNLKGGLVCDSVLELIPKNPGIAHLAGLGLLNHRNSVVKGFLRDHFNGELTARCAGYTNTLRLQHSELVNLPSLKVDWGEQIRGCLVARPGYVLLGSDLSSLEDKWKHHYQYKIDPEYVKSQQSKTFDPHLAIAVMAGLMSPNESDWYKEYKRKPKEEHTEDGDKEFRRLDNIRGLGKTTNYACQYGAGGATVARSAKVSEKIGKKLWEGYWKLNWSIKKIAEMTKVKSCLGGTWQLNPINSFWYSLRTDKDRFSTLIQGSGAYTLDIWIWYMIYLAKQRGLDFRLLGQFHDEVILEVPQGMEEVYRKLVSDSIAAVNAKFKLNTTLGCDIAFGDSYAEIH